MFEKHINVAKSKIPGLSQTLPEKVDGWGRVQKNNQSAALRAFENFVSPGYIGRGNTTEVDKYLNQLYVKTGDNSILPSNMAKNFSVDGEKTNLSAKQYAEAQKVKGQTAYNLVEDVINNYSFKRLSTEQQADVIADIYKYSTAVAKNKVTNYQLSDWVKKADEAKKDGLSVDSYIALRTVRNDLEKTETKSVPEQFLDQLYVSKLSDKEKVAALEHIGEVDVDKYSNVLDKDGDILKAYKVFVNGGSKAENVEEMQKELGGNSYEAFGTYSAIEGKKSYENGQFKGFGTKQLPKAEKLVKKGWAPVDVAKAASAVTGLSNYLGGKNYRTKKAYIKALTAVGFTEKEANEFYSVYGW